MHEPVESCIRTRERVTNLERVFGSSLSYLPAFIVLPNGTVKPALFTDDQVNEAIERAKKNASDIGPRAGRWSRLLTALFGR